GATGEGTVSTEAVVTCCAVVGYAAGEHRFGTDRPFARGALVAAGATGDRVGSPPVNQDAAVGSHLQAVSRLIADPYLITIGSGDDCLVGAGDDIAAWGSWTLGPQQGMALNRRLPE